jgi:hypothetical protein
VEVVVTEIRGNAGCDGGHIENSQVLDERVLVHQEREWLANATSSAQNGNLPDKKRIKYSACNDLWPLLMRRDTQFLHRSIAIKTVIHTLYAVWRDELKARAPILVAKAAWFIRAAMVSGAG